MKTKNHSKRSVRPKKLRTHLLILTVGTLLPMVIFALIAAVLLAKRERATFERGAVERTRALLTAVDTELRRSISTLEALSASNNLDTGDLSAFHEEAGRVLNSQPGWLTIILATPDGGTIVNPRYRFGGKLPPIIDHQSFRTVLQTEPPVVGNLAAGANEELYGFPVRVRVIREGRIKYVLSAVVKPERIHDLLAAQKLPQNWVATVLDGNQQIVSRTVDAQHRIGQLASESLRAALAHAPEGWFRGTTIEGRDVYSAYTRSSLTGWTVAIGIPTVVVEAVARETSWTMTVSIIVAGVLAFSLALALGRRISDPIASLASAARAIASGERPQTREKGDVQELQYLSQALDEAAAAVRAREETQAHLAAIVEASNDAIVSFNLDGTVVAWNPGATRMFGYTAEEMRGRHVSLLVPEDRAHETRELFAAISRGESLSGFETVRLKKHGTLFDVAVSMSPIRNRDGTVTGVAEIFRDITQRKRAYAALSESERRFSTLAELVPQFVWSAEPEGAVDYFNRRWYEYSGLTNEQSLGHGWLQAVHPEEREMVRERWREAVRSGKPIEIEFRLRAGGGEYQWFLMRAVPLCGSDGGIIKWFGTSTNIERQKRAEEVLKDADRRKDEFLAMLGHELRNPLGIISTVVQLLRRQGFSDPNSVELREMIERQVDHMARLMDDLLDVSRIARGRIELRKELCDLTAIVRSAAEDYRSALTMSDLSLRLELPDRRLWVTGDRTRLAQVLANLLHNAQKFTGAGGIVTVQLHQVANSGTAEVSVHDTGIGMDRETLLRAFESFSQGDPGIDRSRGGLGLGLALVKGLVELHGGTVRAYSEGQNRGSEITIELPLERPPAPAPKTEEARAQRRASYRILIVEDNRIAALSMQTFLAEAGHIVETAHNGEEGIKAAKRFEPEVVLCDIGLPGIDGYGVARALRQNPAFDDVYLVAVSGYGQDGDQQRAREAGFDLHLTKPVNLDRLESLLTSLKPGFHRTSTITATEEHSLKR